MTKQIVYLVILYLKELLRSFLTLLTTFLINHLSKLQGNEIADDNKRENQPVSHWQQVKVKEMTG